MTTPSVLVTPIQGPTVITSPTPGMPVVGLGSNINGGWIFNPDNATENLYVDPTGAIPNLATGGTTLPIPPGTTYIAIPGQTTQTMVVAPDASHPFVAVQW